MIAAGKRRLQEELNMTATLKNIGYFQYNARFSNGLYENEIDHVLIGMISPDDVITPNQQEVHSLRWVTIDMLEQALQTQPEQFTPWLTQAFTIVQSYLF